MSIYDVLIGILILILAYLYTIYYIVNLIVFIDSELFGNDKYTQSFEAERKARDSFKL